MNIFCSLILLLGYLPLTLSSTAGSGSVLFMIWDIGNYFYEDPYGASVVFFITYIAIVIFCLIMFALCHCCKGKRPTRDNQKVMALCACLPLTILAIPFWFVYLCFAPRKCNYCDDKSSICISGEHTVQQCYANNSADIDSYPDSSLYQCKTCEKPLKLWPIERLKKSDCIKCRDDIDNDGHNLHICFPCQRDQVQVHHLCSFHNIDTNGLLTVDFSDTDSIPSKIKHKDTSCAQDV